MDHAPTFTDTNKINRDKTLNFTWDNKQLRGFEGDSLSSALLANNIGIVGRTPNNYSLFTGGDFEGSRLSSKILDKISYQHLTTALEQIFLLFKKQRNENEGLGDFCNRIGKDLQFKKLKEVLDDKVQ